MTPLHDACINGHLEIIRYLLDRGASVLAKTDDGVTPLHFLKQWRESAASLNDEELHLYNSIVKRMNSTLERFGQNVERVCVASSTAYENEVKEDGRRRSHTSPSPRKNTQRSPKNERARRRICDEESEEEGSAEYKKVMENLRRRSVNTQERKRKSDEIKKNAHVEDSDDWLEDDLGIVSTAKKRKSSNATIDNLLYTSNTRKSDCHVENRKSSNATIHTTESDSDVEYRIETTSDDSEVGSLVKPTSKRKIQTIETGSDDSGDGFLVTKPKSKRKIQSSLIKAGFSRNKTSPQKKTAEADSSSTPEVVTIKQIQMYSVDVRIEEKLYRVPVPASELNTCTIKWLAEEASKRYFKYVVFETSEQLLFFNIFARREGIKPLLELETKNGAILAEEDLLSMLFPIGTTQAEELNATILKRSLPPLIDRYEEACVQIQSSMPQKILTSQTVSKQNISAHVTAQCHVER